MKTTGAFGSVIALVAGIASVSAHTYLSHLTLDGIKYDEGVCIRPYPANRNFPVKDPSSTDLTCNVGGVTSTAAKTCPVEAGSTITVEWHHDNDSAGDDIIDASHEGPCLVYMAPLETNGSGDVWFKIFEDGYDASTKKWCVDKIRASGGKLDVTLPADIKAGDYLLRTEIIALHEADTDYATNSARGAQYYPNCGQISVSGGGDAVPQGYAIPGIYKTDSPGILFNLYSSYDSYPIPGPPLYVPGSGAGAGDSSSDAALEVSTTEEDNSTVASETSTAEEYSSAAPEASTTEEQQDTATPSATEKETDVPTSSAPSSNPAATTSVAPGKCH
ncbi:hypothetical protein IW140_005690 [Coemansia sp. RSA 1813]|nr:hypothetical protein EV178_006298 [Coemansia sp. RSA 1646]KAJ1767281.1 hypothetical protein LPJ74_005461 [Coemansia sp. RSA 1843]KAJ2092272.1 hypothetical protein IW138_001343 [Coemansia sp. RSA 986]KAJ2211077.1 hypothetical protein EV179_005766 [Coemansia sp. RSA 487]KAJ2564621.1 hypothetical protein IW140_005690 [Coemansia sp. RSA 1813]